jgi:hypothetical protein
MEFAFQSNKAKRNKSAAKANFAALPQSAAKTKRSKKPKGMTIKAIKTKIKSHNAKHCLKLSGSRATLLGRLGKATRR